LAAVAAAGEGARVLLLEPRVSVGGAISGGLCVTDTGTTTAVIGGRTLRFFEAVANATPGAPAGKPLYRFQPHIAEGVFEAWLQSAGVALATEARIASLLMDGDSRRVARALLANGSLVSGRVFVDATYEGALLPMAGIRFSYGREANATFGELDAGVVPSPHPAWTAAHPFVAQPQLPTSLHGAALRWPNGTLLPGLTPPPGALGSADATAQAFCFRTTLTNDTRNMLQPWPRPDGYDARLFELQLRVILERNLTHVDEVCWLGGALGADKFDVNNHELCQFVGLSWPYAAAVAAQDWAAQEAVWRAHRDATLGLFYFLQNDARLPPALRASAATRGLPLDEHTKCGNLPCNLYVREALRMQSDFVFSQRDVEAGARQPDSVGMGAYSIDIMHHHRYDAGGAAGVVQEGGMQAPSFLNATLPPFQVPLRALLPRRADATNVIVPVALSSTHIGFNAVRLEPTWMTLGESAGVAAAMAATRGGDVQDIDVAALQERLRALGQVLSL
jgi:hypothetical protein